MDGVQGFAQKVEHAALWSEYPSSSPSSDPYAGILSDWTSNKVASEKGAYATV